MGSLVRSSDKALCISDISVIEPNCHVSLTAESKSFGVSSRLTCSLAEKLVITGHWLLNQESRLGGPTARNRRKINHQNIFQLNSC